MFVWFLCYVNLCLNFWDEACSTWNNRRRPIDISWNGMIIILRWCQQSKYSNCCIVTTNYTYASRNIFNTIKTSRHGSLEKYTSHFIWKGSKGLWRVLLCERWVGDWTKTATYWPPLFWLSQPFFPVLLAAKPGAQPLQGHGSHSSIFSPTDLNFLSPELYNDLMPTYFLQASQFRTQFNPSTVKVAPDLISSTGCTCYLHWCISSFDSLAGSEVNMQHN